MLRNLKISSKLVVVLAAPIIVLVLVAGYGVQERRSAASDASRVEQLTQFVNLNADLVNQLEVESILSAAYMASDGSQYGDQLQAQRAKTDAALAAYNDELARVNPGRDKVDVEDAINNADKRLNSLKTNRLSVDNVQTTPTGSVANFANITHDLIVVNASLVQEASDPDLLLGLNTVANFQQVKDFQAQQQAIAASAATAGHFVDSAGDPCVDVTNESCQSYTAMVKAGDNADSATVTFEQYASGDAKKASRDAEASLKVDDLTQQVTQQGQDGNSIDVSSDQYIAAAQDGQSSLASVEHGFVLNVIDRANHLAADAKRAANLYIGFAILAIIIAVTIAYLVARATAGPLRKLTSAAYALSTDKLPGLVDRLRNPDESAEPLSASITPIDINSKDEVGQLADAFNSIQQVTIEVAEEQSQLLRKGIGDIFINLARRNQTLLDRQIEFIDQLEANEEDPDQLDNLFKLDHLATRMRRNAESLLVLAGAEPPRRRGRPVALADVVRVAIGEVEDFARIQLLALDEATVGGNVAVDLAHLLSELMENATHFSPPDTMVEIVGHRAGSEGYIISVSDQGIGMSADQLADANIQLARPPLVGLALSRSLGFIVIGRLAQRFGISVKLTASPSGGVTALVTLPPDLVTYPGEEPVEGPAEPPADESVESPFATAVAVEEAVVDEVPVAEEVAEAEVEVAEEPPPVVEPEPEPVAEAEPEPVAEAPIPAAVADSTDDLLDELLEEVVPEGDEFDRGLQSLVDEELAPGPVEPPAPSSAELEPSEDDSVPGAFGSVGTIEPEAPEAEPVVPEAAEPEPVEAEAEAPSADALTAAGLVKRTPKKRSPHAAGGAAMATATAGRSAGQSQRSPEEVRKMLSRYRSGLNKGRGGADSEGKSSD